MCFLHEVIDTSAVEPSKAAQDAHDALLALLPDGASHSCDLCSVTAENKEVAQVGDADRTYTEAEHLALMADAVKRETAELSTAKSGLETSVSEATAKVDVLEGEKAALETKVSEIQAEFDTFKADIEKAKAVEDRKTERVDAVKAANDKLPEAYFTDERAQAWAEMTDETFALVVDGLKAIAGSGSEKETAAFGGGESPASKQTGSTKTFLAARRGAAN